ncbi:hypothetical protein [Actinacidiphila oryziradicis]|uniref:Phytanoyl-CoA dioxygenase family protein n=1 Tax=Actinacidiphila oryziradicis TaxID=2571141 RepID=A0A4U0T179_9ACTN|nr:hypothetical protein [Actinacidiphila oryziradicis]TKA06505.1 hypothetical protein FCI23_30980 [Actinacidiphila oryziradicis]
MGLCRPIRGESRFDQPHQHVHREPPVGCVELEEAYRLAPRLRSHEMSEETSFEPGDVVAHCSWVVHGTDANVGTRPRWVYRPLFFPADAVYMGVPSPTIAGRGIGPFEILDHPDFPITYEPTAARAGG